MWSTSLIFDNEATDSMASRAASICIASNRVTSLAERREICSRSSWKGGTEDTTSRRM